jgi:hypothetical protein
MNRNCDLKDFMDNREWRIAAAWMAVESRKERHKPVRPAKPQIRNPGAFTFCLFGLLTFLVILFLHYR